MKVIHKRLKTILKLEVKKLDLAFLVLKLGRFLFFNYFFLNLADI